MEHPVYYFQKLDYLHIPMFSKRHVFDKITGKYSIKQQQRALEDGVYICLFPHRHAEIEMIYIVRGSMYLGNDSGLNVASEGETWIFRSNEVHYGYINDEHPVVEYCYFTVNLPELLPPINYGIMGKLDKLVFSERVKDQVIGNLINSLPEYCRKMGKSGMEELAMLSALYGIIARLGELKCIKDDTQNLLETPFEMRINKFLEEHYHEAITTEVLQKQFMYSKSYFCRLFKKHFGQNFSAYLDCFRINKAITIMKFNNHLSVNQIGIRVGYPNHSVFSYKFRQITGLSPSEYMKQNMAFNGCSKYR